MTESKTCERCGAELPSDAPQGMCPQCLMAVGVHTGAPSTGSQTGSRDPQMTTVPSEVFAPPTPEELAQQFPQLEILDLLDEFPVCVCCWFSHPLSPIKP